MKMEHMEPATTKIRLGRRIYKWKFSTTNFQKIDFKELLNSNKGNHNLEHNQGDVCGMEELVNLTDALSEEHRCGQYRELYVQNRCSLPIQLSKQTAQKMAKTWYLPPEKKKKKMKYCMLLEEAIAFEESNINRFCPFLMGGLSSGIILIEGHSTKYMTNALLITVKVVKTKKNLSPLNSKKIKPVNSKGNQP